MFVSAGAAVRLQERRRTQFAATYVQPLLAEARKLGLGTASSRP